MTATNQNLIIYIGDDGDFDADIYDENGDLLTVTGATALWVLKTEAGETATLQKTDGSGITISGSSVTVTISDTETSALTEGRYFHALSLTIAGKTRTVFAGSVEVKPR